MTGGKTPSKDTNLASSLEAGIIEGMCAPCPWNTKIIDNTTCARTVVASLISARNESPPPGHLNFDGPIAEFENKAKYCAQTLINHALSEQELLEPTEVWDRAGVAVVVMRHNGF